MAITWETHNGVKYLNVDYGDCKTGEQMIAQLEEEAKIVRETPSLMILTSYEGAPSSNEFMDRLKVVSKESSMAHIKKNATIGITGVKKILFNTYIIFSHDKTIKAFDTREAALAWLVS